MDITAYDYRFALACKTAVDLRMKAAIEGKQVELEVACRQACKEVGLPETMFWPMASLIDNGYEEDFEWIDGILAGHTEEILKGGVEPA